MHVMHCDGLSLPCHPTHETRTGTLTARRNPGSHLRHRLQRPRPHRGGADRTHKDYPGQGNEGCSAASVCQQAGFGRRCVLQACPVFGDILTTRQPCDQRKSRIACNWRRLPRTMYGRLSPAARQQERAFSRDWYVRAATTLDPAHC
jgi:hypothetical protein